MIVMRILVGVWMEKKLNKKEIGSPALPGGEAPKLVNKPMVVSYHRCHLPLSYISKVIRLVNMLTFVRETIPADIRSIRRLVGKVGRLKLSFVVPVLLNSCSINSHDGRMNYVQQCRQCLCTVYEERSSVQHTKLVKTQQMEVKNTILDYYYYYWSM